MLQVDDAAEIKGMVGIFWLMPNLQDLFYVSAVNVTAGQPYGDWLLSWDDHATLWDQLCESGVLGAIPRRYREDYARLPRGRVSFNRKNRSFTVYSGNWMNDDLKKIIMNRFELDPGNTVVEIDGHYQSRFRILPAILVVGNIGMLLLLADSVIAKIINPFNSC